MFFSCCNVISGTQSIGIFDPGQCEEIQVKASVASGQAQLFMSGSVKYDELWGIQIKDSLCSDR